MFEFWKRRAAPREPIIKNVNLDVFQVAQRAGLEEEFLVTHQVEIMRFAQALTREIMATVMGARETPLDDVPKEVRERIWKMQHGGDDRAA